MDYVQNSKPTYTFQPKLINWYTDFRRSKLQENLISRNNLSQSRGNYKANQYTPIDAMSNSLNP